MKRRILLAMALLFAIFAKGARGDEAARPNILVLYANDWRYDTLGCAGHPIVETPHLDRLASEGLRFTQACVTTSICGVKS